MELDVLKILLGHREHVARVGKEHVTTFLVFRHILVFAFLEVIKFLRVVTLNPTSLVEMNGLPTTLGIVLILQTVLDNFKLQLSDRSNNLAAIELVDK